MEQSMAAIRPPNALDMIILPYQHGEEAFFEPFKFDM